MAQLDSTIVAGQGAHITDHQTMAVKANQVFDVTDFGAVGDGSTDDTVAIQAALDAADTAGGGTTFLPLGTYIVSATVTIPGGVSLTGVGRGVSIIKVPDGADSGSSFDILTTELSGADHYMAHFTVDGNRQNNTGWNPIGESVYGLSVRSDRCLVYDCEFKNVVANGAGVPVTGGEVTFRDCFSHTNGKKGFHNGAVNRISYIGNTCYSNLNDVGIGAHQGIYETIISGNRCYLNGASGIELGDSLGTSGTASRETIVSNNILVDNVGHGLFCYADDSDNTDLAYHVTIANNVMLRNLTGMRIESAKYWTIVGNVVRDNEQQGIYVSSCEAGTITGNTVVNNNVLETASVDAEILLSDDVGTFSARTTTDNVTVVGNVIYDTRGTEKSVYGVSIGGGNTNCVVIGNIINGPTTSIRNFGDQADGHMFGFNIIDQAPNAVAIDIVGARDETEGAIKDLLTKLAALGLFSDSTTAS